MIRIFFLLGIATFTSACSDPKPPATLSYSKFRAAQDTFVVEFASDLNIEDLYGKDKEIIARKVICALGMDQNFDVAHKMQYVFRGDLELKGTSMVGNRISHRYFSNGDFYEYPPASNDLKLLTGSTLINVLGNKKSVPCKVVMTIYMTSPYYSRIMEIPTKDILRAANLLK